MTRVAIIDCGTGNLRSVQKACERLGEAATITADPEAVRTAERVILPGVGAFGDAMAQLRASGLDVAVREFIATGRPFLGICLGLQLLFERGHEDGNHVGLGVLAGAVHRFPAVPGLKVPHMGWNQIRFQKADCPLFRGVDDGAEVYFVHSYRAECAEGDDIAATTEYAGAFPSVVQRGNVLATQFHPEKSQGVGLRLLGTFLGWVPGGPR